MSMMARGSNSAPRLCCIAVKASRGGHVTFPTVAILERSIGPNSTRSGSKTAAENINTTGPSLNNESDSLSIDSSSHHAPVATSSKVPAKAAISTRL